ncbi:MAG: histidine kinase [bacterium]
MENESDLHEEIVMLEKEIAELKARMPAHSIPVAMLQQLEDLEEALDSKKRACEP